MLKSKLISLATCILTIVVAGPSIGTAVSDAPKKVLFFSSEDSRLPAGLTIEEAIRTTFDKTNPGQTVYFNEAQDNARIPNDKYEAEYLTYLRRKYEGEKIDLIFVRAASGLRFLLKHESEIFIDTPKIFITNDEREVDDLSFGPNVTGIFGKLELRSTLELILTQHPYAKRVVVITGSSSRDEVYLAEAKKDFSAYSNKIAIDYLSQLPIPDLQKEVASLPSDNVVLFVSYGRDPAGNGYSLPGAISLVQPSSSVPMYAVADTAMGTGIVGGEMLNFQLMGQRGAEMGLRILAGEKPSDIQPQTVESVRIFDWRQLERWKISEGAIPAGSIVRFKEPTFWEQYKWLAIGAVSFSVLEALLIAWLLFLRARRKEAEIESLKYAALAREEHARLNEVVSNVPGIVWESRVEPGSNSRAIRFVSDYAERMLGYPIEEWLSTPGFLLTIVVEEDRDLVEREIQEIFYGGGEGVVQFRWVAKDGNIFWAEAHLVAISDEKGSPVGLRGVTMDVTERKSAEEKLRISELELIEAQRVAQVGNWEWKIGSDTLTWSEELYRILGLDPSKPAPTFKEHERLLTPECFRLLTSAFKGALHSGVAYEVELELIRADDHRHIFVNARGEAVRDEDSKILALRGTVQDITYRKTVEEALIESEERYRTVVETQTELICRYLPDTTLTFVNDAYCRYFGKSRAELVGTKFADLIPSKDRDVAFSHIASLLETSAPVTYEHEVIRADATRGWQQWTDRAVETSNGHPKELQGIGRDITEKRQVEDALRASESRFRIMADSAPVLIWMCGPDKLFTYVNQGWLDFTGRSIDMEVGNGWSEGIHPDDSERMSQIFDSSFDRREPFRIEYRLRGADGDYHWLYDSGMPRFSSEGDFLGYIGSCVDISDRKRAEEASKRAHEEVVRLQKQLQEENIYLREVIKLEHAFEEIIGHSDALKYVLFKIEQVAPTDATVLITGETGTGKELVARAIHHTSLRKNRPLVKVNCAALSASLIESELFGHERGAFTGAAARKIGRFELADGATIFLDEVGELPLELQSKLLRVIQEGEFERLGSSKTIKADVRIVAATNRNLDAEVKKGTFREDLLFRLNVFPITVPPLRERKDDIPELIEYFTTRFAKKLGKDIRSISPASVRRLCDHSWPGNIRELANVIERSVINAQTDNLQVSEVFATNAKDLSTSSSETLETIERSHIVKVLELTNWKIEGPKGAAVILGLNPSTLRTRMSKLGIVKDRHSLDTHLARTS